MAITRRAKLAPFRNRRGDTVALPEASATDAKNEFGRVLETALQEGGVTITRHGKPTAVLLAVEEFNALAGAGRSDLDTLTEEFDALLARMQGPSARRAMQEAFEANPEELGKAAVAAVQRRRKRA